VSTTPGLSRRPGGDGAALHRRRRRARKRPRSRSWSAYRHIAAQQSTKRSPAAAKR